LGYHPGVPITLVDMFRAERPEAVASDALERALAACVAAGAAAWPGVTVSTARFVRAIATRAGDVAAIAMLVPADLYLACGCAEGDAAALVELEARYGRVIERAIAATGAPPAERADLGQIVRQRILVEGTGRPPRIASYSGQGTLAAWIRVVAAREVARDRTRRTHAEDADDALALRIAPDDPELAYVKRRYRAEFKQAFQHAVDGLESRDRLVLRQHTLDGLGIDQLAALHHVHRATAARWITSAREAVRSATQRALTERLQLAPDELDSLIRMIRSELDVSLPRLLAEPAED